MSGFRFVFSDSKIGYIFIGHLAKRFGSAWFGSGGGGGGVVC